MMGRWGGWGTGPGVKGVESGQPAGDSGGALDEPWLGRELRRSPGVFGVGPGDALGGEQGTACDVGGKVVSPLEQGGVAGGLVAVEQELPDSRSPAAACEVVPVSGVEAGGQTAVPQGLQAGVDVPAIRDVTCAAAEAAAASPAMRDQARSVTATPAHPPNSPSSGIVATSGPWRARCSSRVRAPAETRAVPSPAALASAQPSSTPAVPEYRSSTSFRPQATPGRRRHQPPRNRSSRTHDSLHPPTPARLPRGQRSPRRDARRSRAAAWCTHASGTSRRHDMILPACRTPLSATKAFARLLGSSQVSQAFVLDSKYILAVMARRT